MTSAKHINGRCHFNSFRIEKNRKTGEQTKIDITISGTLAAISQNGLLAYIITDDGRHYGVPVGDVTEIPKPNHHETEEGQSIEMVQTSVNSKE